jgi:uncharacterized membrane protein YqgA involved in biofilm formation
MLEFKDVLALVIVVSLTVLLYYDKIPIHVYTTFLGAIIGFYFGVYVGVRKAMKGVQNEQTH